MIAPRPLVTALLLTFAAAPLGAELKFTSRIQVKKIQPPDAFFAIVFEPVHRITPGKVDVTTYVAGDRVRVEGMGPVLGLPDDTVLLTRADGAMLFVQPSSSTFFVRNGFDAVALASQIGTTVKTSRKGRSDVILAQRTERVVHEIRVHPILSSPQPLNADYHGTTRDAVGNPVSQTATGDTTERRQADALNNDYRSRHSGDGDVIKIESWESAAFGRAAVVAARSGAGAAAIGTGGFSALADLGFPLRQVLTYKGAGYQIETRVTSAAPTSVDVALFEVPAGFKEVPAPPGRPQFR